MANSIRRHLVLVPGFVGFDVLGQVHYYAGVTRAFTQWQGGCSAPEVALHYFDNFPTASVALRSQRLLRYLAKKVIRGEFGPEDRIALIGHSTGCLDIRSALHADPGRDSIATDNDRVSYDEIIQRCDRLVFLSAPHFGTRLADFWIDLAASIQAEAKNAGLAVQLNRGRLADARRAAIDLLIGGAPPHAIQSDLLLAIVDALNESDERPAGGPLADERQARSELALWLAHIGEDLQIVHDLRSHDRPCIRGASPAHFGDVQRADELRRWRTRGVRTRSYATIIPRPAQRDTAICTAIRLLRSAKSLDPAFGMLNQLAARWALQPLALAATLSRGLLGSAPLLPALWMLQNRPSFVFDLFQALCESPDRPFCRPQGLAPSLIKLGSNEVVTSDSIAPARSDGVVNTLSMLWPYDSLDPGAHRCFLVEADHGDIIGHYQREEANASTGQSSAVRPAHHRSYNAYDFFPSDSGFGQTHFEDIWRSIFSFCAGADENSTAFLEKAL